MYISDLLTDSIMDTNFGKSISPNGLTPVGCGLDRFAFRIEVGQYKGKILKIAKDNKQLHLRQNKNEIRTWLNIKDKKYKKYFCPIIIDASDLDNYKYLVMEEAQTNISIEEAKRTVVPKLKHANIPVTDVSSGNFGYYKNEIVLIDYPFGRF